MEHNTAFVFPGQGSQFAGMGKDVADKYPAARRVFDEIDEALGFSISRLCFEGPEEDLKLTANTQPAILAVSSALHAVLEEHGATRRDLVAGHSLGEYSAIVSVGGLTPGEAAKIVHQRGRFMQEAVPVGTGGMAALIGPSVEDAQAICDEAAEGDVVAVANINAPGQIVIAGTKAGIERAIDVAKKRGVRRALPLPVSGALPLRVDDAGSGTSRADSRRRSVQGPLVLADLERGCLADRNGHRGTQRAGAAGGLAGAVGRVRTTHGGDGCASDRGDRPRFRLDGARETHRPERAVGERLRRPDPRGVPRLTDLGDAYRIKRSSPAESDRQETS
jgi:malonyl CoA-acyl carrier protein transacylase